MGIIVLAASTSALAALLQTSIAPPVYDTQAVTRACDSVRAGEEIIVCGNRTKDRYRLPRLPPVDATFGSAEMTVGATKVGISTERGMIGGIPTNRLMVKWKVKF